MSLPLAIFILGVLLVVGWFAAGTHFNVRKGEAALRWLHDSLPLVGEKTTLRWLGSSVVELKVQQAKAPFRQAEVLVVLEPRDVGPLWGLARLRGRRDLFIFRGSLRSQPQMEVEALDPGAWSTHGLKNRLPSDWTPMPAPAPLAAYAPGQQAAASQLLAAADLDGCPLVRLALRRSEPNLEAQWRLDQLRKHPARAVFETLRRVAERV